jgi:hypothetical protein
MDDDELMPIFTIAAIFAFAFIDPNPMVCASAGGAAALPPAVFRLRFRLPFFVIHAFRFIDEFMSHLFSATPITFFLFIIYRH